MARTLRPSAPKKRCALPCVSTVDAAWQALLALSVLVLCYLAFLTQVHLNPAPSPLSSSDQHRRRNINKAGAGIPSGSHQPPDDVGPSFAVKKERRRRGRAKAGRGAEDAAVSAAANGGRNDPGISGAGTSTRKKRRGDDRQGGQPATAALSDAADGEETFRFIPRRKRRRQERGNATAASANSAKKDSGPPLNLTGTKWDLEETAPMPNVSHVAYYRNIATADGGTGEANLWDDDPALPQWAKDYFTWHQWKRRHWDLAGWRSERWLVMQCLMEQDRKKCGGTSDRLKPFPVLLKIAYQTKRILLIRWTRPSTLEEFLVPPRGGVDWRVPPGLEGVIDDESNGKKVAAIKQVQKYSERGVSLVRSRYQTATAQNVYNMMPLEEGEPDFHGAFPHLWRYFFTPSPAVANVLRGRLDSLGLVPGGYVAAHLRALYAVDRPEDRKVLYIQMFAENALACATELRPGVPIFFASDSAAATAHAVAVGSGHVSPKYGVGGGGGGVARVPPVHASVLDPNPPWHLDMYVGPPYKFYDTFVDLYLMALAGCVTYNKGGYGHWALLIGGNLSCGLQQEVIGLGPTIKKPCHFQDATGAASGAEPNITTTEKPLFLPPMDDDDEDTRAS